MPDDNKPAANNFPPTATLIVGNRTHELPLIVDAAGYPAIDVSKLFADAKIMTYDPGFGSTAGCKSSITFIDGDKGILQYRGYPIEQIAEQGTFLETAYLLLNGELPTSDELTAFTKEIVRRAPVHDQMIKILERFPRQAHPMALIESMVTQLGIFYNNTDIKTPDGMRDVCLNLIAKIPTIVAMAHRYTSGMPIFQPQSHASHPLDYTENFLRMCLANYDGTYSPDRNITAALDRIFILHADHEQNASTATVRIAGSTGVEPYAAISSGIVALWGPAHGGAN